MLLCSVLPICCSAQRCSQVCLSRCPPPCTCNTQLQPLACCRCSGTPTMWRHGACLGQCRQRMMMTPRPLPRSIGLCRQTLTMLRQACDEPAVSNSIKQLILRHLGLAKQTTGSSADPGPAETLTTAHANYRTALSQLARSMICGFIRLLSHLRASMLSDAAAADASPTQRILAASCFHWSQAQAPAAMGCYQHALGSLATLSC